MANDDRTGMVQVDLSDDEVAQRAAKLASEGIALEALEAKKETHVKSWNEEIRQIEASMSVLCHEVDERKAWVPAQTGLFEAANDEADAEDAEAAAAAKPARGRRRRSGNDVHA